MGNEVRDFTFYLSVLKYQLMCSLNMKNILDFNTAIPKAH